MHLLLSEIAQSRAHELARNAERPEAQQRHAIRIAESSEMPPRRPRHAFARVRWAR
ncbi:MAG TPA: hypothetical protein VG276_18985 [Actinomycetes bacterium]|jgi:hypothetical protein|nr:hypothetical protein [Actinomycetes bacterium]